MKSVRELLPPKAPKAGTKLPHQGLGVEDLQWAVSAGYEPIDVRFAGSAYLILQGILLGTVVLDDQQMAALELKARLEKLGLREEETKPQQEQDLRDDALEALRGLPASTMFSVLKPRK